MPSDTPISGIGWGALVTRVDPLIAEYVRAKGLPGMTVAATRQGRLLLSRGYGFANTATLRAMLPFMRSRIGSVTKAVITGPAGVQLMREHGLDPATTRLYGPGGLFGQAFDTDIEIGVSRASPIAAIAVAADGRVHVWYTNGEYSVGDGRVLDLYQKPAPYDLPEGKTPALIRSISFDADGHTNTWYDDGTHSRGTFDRLGAVTRDDDGAPLQVALPPGYSIEDVVGVGIDKATGDVHVWYGDGTVSTGTLFDFDVRQAPRPFKVAAWPEGTPWDIRDADLDFAGEARAWFRNGTASAGTVLELAAHQLPVKVAIPEFDPDHAPPDWTQWYREITVQHLLDHQAGFERSGDLEGTERLFARPPADLTYEHGHAHFLQTRKLLFRPGTATSYSNHGFGLWYLLVPAITRGQFSFRDWVWSHYLEPMDVQELVVPMTTHTTVRDAWPHVCTRDGCTPLEFTEASQGLAAGEYTASAQDLARIMADLANKYPPEQLDRMGWGRARDGRLTHSGLIQGGAAFVVMYPPGYKTADGTDLGGIHVALATHTAAATADFSGLAAQIALAVVASEPPPDYDDWPRRPRP